MDAEVAREVVRMMETVTLPGGTATQAHILGYRVAGKTGTARIASGGGYSRRYVAFFAGLVPASNPRFSMVVVINDPDARVAYYGGLVSAPVFHDVMDGALRLMDVAPDDLDAWLAVQAEAEAKRRPPLAQVVAATPPTANAVQANATAPMTGLQGGGQ
jgi:cell division protein FtsI (penicillin-binding protein 3)